MSSISGTAHLDLNALRAFVLVVEAGGITEGARRAALPKSTVSRQVRDLEARLGEQLLTRRGRGMTTTGAGRRLYEAARSAVGALEVSRQDVFAPPVAGRVRVSAPVTLARGLLKDLLADFLGRHPAIAVEVDLFDRFTAAETPAADVALCVGITPGEHRPAQPVGFVEARLYAAPSLFAAAGTPRTPAEIERMPVLTQGCARGGRTTWTLADPGGATQQISFTPRLVTADPDLLLAAALAGHGVCRMATFLAEPHLRSGRLVPVLDGYVAERHEVALAVLRRMRDAAVRCFATEMTESLKERLRPRLP
jgi:DNA-binding transcriptional LysR family regulator